MSDIATVTKATRLITKAAKLTLNVNRAQRTYETLKDAFAIVFDVDRKFLKPMVDSITCHDGMAEISPRQKVELDNFATTLKYFRMLKIDAPMVDYLLKNHGIEIKLNDVPASDRIPKEKYTLLSQNENLTSIVSPMPRTTGHFLGVVLKKSAEAQLEIFDNVSKVNDDIKPQVMKFTDLRGEEFSRLVSINRNLLVKREPRVAAQVHEFKTAQRTFSKLVASH